MPVQFGHDYTKLGGCTRQFTADESNSHCPGITGPITGKRISLLMRANKLETATVQGSLPHMSHNVLVQNAKLGNTYTMYRHVPFIKIATL